MVISFYQIMKIRICKLLFDHTILMTKFKQTIAKVTILTHQL